MRPEGDSKKGEGLSRVPVGGAGANGRPDWESWAMSALQREICRRDEELSPGTLRMPTEVRNDLLRRVSGGNGIAFAESAQQPLRWLLPVAACFLVAFAVLAVWHRASWPDDERMPNNSAQAARDVSSARTPWSEFPDNVEFEDRLIAQPGMFSMRESGVSFTRLVVVDEQFLEPRVFLSNSFHFAIGQDLAAMDTDGG